MTKLPRFLISIVLLAAVCACEPEPVEETVWDDQIQALDKAREVEDDLAKRAGQIAKDLDYDTGTDEDEDEDLPRR